jgi:2-oxoglutarate dehydrogenase E1 component
MSSKSAQLSTSEISLGRENGREQIFDAYRRWGYLDANLNPFGGPIGGGYSDLLSEGEGAEEARRIYCGTIGAEFMHLPQRDRREWIQNRLENPAPQQVDRRWLAERLLQADLFEQIMQTRYLGTKRYSGEGATAQIPLLDMILETGAELGATTTVMAMSHRGRLTRAACLAEATSNITRARRANFALVKARPFACIWFPIPAILRRLILWPWAARWPSKNILAQTA